jgi:creatinine amidohydrolase
MSKGYFLERLTWPQAKAAFEKTSVVVFPLGSNEQHGPHLPTGTDWLVARELARRVGERANVIVTPTLPIGFAKYHTVFPGTLAISEDTLTRMLIEICEDLIKYGVTHILFVDGHGGNLSSLARCGAWLRDQGVLAATAPWWEMTQIVNPNWGAIGHADYIETSAVLAIDESLVDMKMAKIPTNKPLSDKISLDHIHQARFKNGVLGINLVMTDVTDTGDMLEIGVSTANNYDTPPTASSKEMGNTILDGLADYLTEFVEEFRKVQLPPVGTTGPTAGMRKAGK